MQSHTILIVEDIASLAMTYAAQIEAQGYKSIIVDNGADALQMLRDPNCAVSAVLLDLQLPDIDGLELLKDNPELVQSVPFIVATADGSITKAIEAMRQGAYDFLVKPLAAPRMIATLRSAIEASDQQPVQGKPDANDPAADNGSGYLGFVGASQPMTAIYAQIASVARSRATVFIAGESGTGKELCAEAIHKGSPRAAKPFVAINCGAIPENLLESELFGHLKGSFTGAVSDRIGAVQAADGGTLFLDEICEMELKLQVKLLRFLQTGTIQRVGSSRAETVDVRIVCATNRDAQTEVAEGRFRGDLYYRLAVIPLELPPLRVRGEDVVRLANHFLQKFAHEEMKQFHPLSRDCERVLKGYDWPGNIRELQNIMRRISVMCDGPDIPVEAWRLAIPSNGRPEQTSIPVVSPTVSTHQIGVQKTVPRHSDIGSLIEDFSLDELERIAVEHAISRSAGSLPAAARRLGVSPSTLYRKRERWAQH